MTEMACDFCGHLHCFMRLENRYSLNMLCWYLHVLLLLNLYFLGVGRLYGVH